MRATDDASTSAGLPKVLVAGPTAVGKTSLSLRMASALNGEIVSADSVQVFEGLDVGASKLPVNERNGIPHHLLDVADPSKEFGAGEFYEHALEAIDGIVSRGKTPIVVGGTGMYLRWLIDGKPSTPPSEPEAAARAKEAVRAAAEREMSRLKKSGADGDDDDVGNGWAGAVRALADAGRPGDREQARGERLVQAGARDGDRSDQRPAGGELQARVASPIRLQVRRADVPSDRAVPPGGRQGRGDGEGRDAGGGGDDAREGHRARIHPRRSVHGVQAGDGLCGAQGGARWGRTVSTRGTPGVRGGGAARHEGVRQATVHVVQGRARGAVHLAGREQRDAERAGRSGGGHAAFHGETNQEAFRLSAQPCSDETRGEVDAACAKELKSYAPRQTIVNMPEVSRELCARVDELARRLRRVRELRARESAGE